MSASGHQRASGEPSTRGVVRDFDEFVGLGTVCDDHGTEHRFHCVEIADGSRKIAVGTRVRFTPRVKYGRWEAFGLLPA